MTVALSQTVAGDELAARPPCAGVRGLHRSEQLLLEPVAEILVDLLVRVPEVVERERDLIGGLADLADDALTGFEGGVRHAYQVTRHPEVVRKDLATPRCTFH